MNVHDSEKMLGILSHEGYIRTDTPDSADLIIFNTCAIREKAEQKFYSELGRTKRLKRKNRNLNIAVAGCVAQDTKREIFRRASHVDFILGPQNVHLIHDMVEGKVSQTAFGDNGDIAFMEYETIRDSRVKAWVSIMYGCNNFCSYCIVPYTRGREVSRPDSSILSEIQGLVERGYKEVTLLGQNVNSYKSEIDFPGLLRKIDKTGIKRVRFVTSHPRDLSLQLIQVMSELPSLCEHIHLPIQSGSDRVLSRMNRGYTYREYVEKVRMLRDAVPGLAVTTDIITGFPGEDENDYQDTVDALREIAYDGIFAFKFSPRRGTKAYDMENQVPEQVRAERLNAILKLQEEITYRKNKALEGTVQEILIEGPSENDETVLTGRTRTNKIVAIPDSHEHVGSCVSVIIQKARQHSLYGANPALENAAV